MNSDPEHPHRDRLLGNAGRWMSAEHRTEDCADHFAAAVFRGRWAGEGEVGMQRLLALAVRIQPLPQLPDALFQRAFFEAPMGAPPLAGAY